MRPAWRRTLSHIISFDAAEEAPTREVARELRGLLEACTRAVARHFTQPDLARCALLLKRQRVQLPTLGGQWFRTGRAEERLGELINILATVARTVDALDHLAASVGGTVVKCNPSTSDHGHDIEVVADERQVVVEVSDVAGNGNANSKMTNDLTTLLAASPDAELLLAVSETSGRWLTNGSSRTPGRLGASCRLEAKVPAEHDLPTWIIAVERALVGT